MVTQGPNKMKKGCGDTRLVVSSAKTWAPWHTPLILVLQEQKRVGLCEINKLQAS